jgi:hypothetical protein
VLLAGTVGIAQGHGRSGGSVVARRRCTPYAAC